MAPPSLGAVLLALRLGRAQLLLEEEGHGVALLPRVVDAAVGLGYNSIDILNLRLELRRK